MKIFNSIGDAKIIPLFYEKTKQKLNVLVSYPYLNGSAHKLAVEYRNMIDSLFLDSGAFSEGNKRFIPSVAEYGHFIARYGNRFDAFFNLDDEFDNPDHNFENQVFLEKQVGSESRKPIPVIHDVEDPYGEFKTYVKQGHDFIAIGSNKKVPDEVMKKIGKKYPNVKLHLFGKLSRKTMFKFKPFSADASTWAKSGALGSVHYWDAKDGKEWRINLEAKEKTAGKNINFDDFPHKKEFVAFLSEKFGYTRNLLISDYLARQVVNLYFFKQLEDLVNSSK
jgi:hypothetical protein